MLIQSNWEEVFISQGRFPVRDSTLYFDDINNPSTTPRDRKNMRVKTDSLYINTKDDVDE